MQMGGWHLFTVRVSMGWPSKIQSDKQDDLSCAVLVCTFPEIESASLNIKEK